LHRSSDLLWFFLALAIAFQIIRGSKAEAGAANA